jgi:hypothetical protein
MPSTSRAAEISADAPASVASNSLPAACIPADGSPAAEEADGPVSPAEQKLAGACNAGSAQLLDAQELAQLAARAEEPGDEVVGGALTNQQLTYIVIALAAAVIVLVAK